MPTRANRPIGLGRYVKGGWIVPGLLIVVAPLVPRLLGAAYLNLASIDIAHGYVALGTDVSAISGASNFAGLPNALHFASAALERNRHGTAAWRQMGRALLLGGRLADAQAAFSRALEADSGDVTARVALAQLHVGMGQYRQAAAEWRALRAPAQLVTLGDKLLELGYWTEAIDAYQAAIEVQPDYVDAYYPLGWALYQRTRDWAGAPSTFLSARELAPNSPWPYVSIGDLYMNHGRIEEAIPWYARALEVAPHERGLDSKVAWAYTAYGDEMLATGQLAEAETAYRTAVAVVPTYVAAYHGLAKLAWQGQNNPRASIAVLEHAITLDPADFRSYVLMGDIPVAGDSPAAAEWYQRAEVLLLGTPVATADTRAQLGLVYARQGRYEAAIAELQAAIQLDPRNGWYHIGLGDVYREMRDIEGARREYRLAVELDPFNSHARRQLAGLSALDSSD